MIISEPKYAPESYVFKARLPVTSDATPVFSKLKSCGLIHSGFHLSVRISIKLSKQSVLLEGLGEGKGGRWRGRGGGGGEGGEVEGKGREVEAKGGRWRGRGGGGKNIFSTIKFYS